MHAEVCCSEKNLLTAKTTTKHTLLLQRRAVLTISSAKPLYRVAAALSTSVITISLSTNCCKNKINAEKCFSTPKRLEIFSIPIML